MEFYIPLSWQKNLDSNYFIWLSNEKFLIEVCWWNKLRQFIYMTHFYINILFARILIDNNGLNSIHKKLLGFYLYSVEDWTQILMHAGEPLYHCIILNSLIFFICVESYVFYTGHELSL